MKRKVLIVLGILSICLTASACGSNTTDREQETETIAVVETTEILEVETEAIEISTEQVEESTEDTEAIAQEKEIAENEVGIENGEEGTLTEEKTIETSEVGEIVPISYEDYNVNSNGYSNYIEGYGSGDFENCRIVICDKTCTDDLDDSLYNVYDQTTYRGITLGDSREQVLEQYGEPHNEVEYKNHRWDHDGLESQYNINYTYIDERYPEVFFCLSFNMDQNDNVLNVFYEAILMKWYEQNQ